MVEREVPFIQIYHGGYENNWDQHGDLVGGHTNNCYETDQPIAGLLTDLKQRGLLDSTLVIWGGEFGRAPVSQDNDGRDHNPYGFTMWMAGGGVKRGYNHGETDEFGYLPIQGAVSMPDLHATVLHLMGINEEHLTYQFGGREQTATNGLGHVVKDVIA
jgi:arylsulfatase A-like enzyme